MVKTDVAEFETCTDGWSWRAFADASLDAVGVALLASEVLVLFAGIVARTVFVHPLIWSTEFARFIFVWLTMVGAVVAVRDDQHMRMTAFTHRLSPSWQGWLGAAADLVQMLAVLAMIEPSLRFLQIEQLSSLSQLGISSAWEAAGLVVGFILMAAYLVCSLLARPRADILRGGIGALVVVGAAFLIGLALSEYTLPEVVFVFVILLFGAVLAGVPIAFAFGFSSIFYLLVTGSAPLGVMASQVEQGTSSIILLAVPLFVLLGGLLTVTRLAPAMMRFLSDIFGQVKGGLFYVLIGGILLVSGISGAKTADLAAVAPIVVPEMKRHKIDEGHILAVTASCGAMAETIPPSIVLIIIGAVTGTSITALFEAGLMPAIVLAVILAVLARFWAGGHTVAGARPAARQVLRSFLYGLPALALPFVIRFCVIDGIATATEIATIGTVYAILLGLVFYGGFRLSALYAALSKSVGLSGAIMFIIAVATAMSWTLTQSGFAEDITHLMLALPGGQVGFILGSIFLMIVLGSFLEGIPILVLFGPILFPIARTLAISDVRYGIVVVLAMGIGLFAPPVGLGYYATGIITEIDPNKGLVKIWGYLAALVAGLMAIALVP
ncbi:TRAP transporter large permease subunit [Paralcaligenes sp. KSB-10]|jgi:tripartite ATP-independent transporter DctM subunit|uniref:TRAP transporter large permease n=1 Tax=Paralcaligenes sp. KSB-10 TaxID=2901142 RepID=UPI001E407376|nr:TRAP transporter large permease subunit [Paralcaligenes sp. KSB-10]UHL62459.1 TRAP transporter large permease subunit [Paralcaligenes sp. KSB-10]